MKKLAMLAAVLLLAPGLAHAQRFVRQADKVDYTLVVDGQASDQTDAWWKAFQAKATREDYCFDLPTLPLVDRPELGDKAVILKMGGVGQLVQLIEIPPGGQTKWHGYGFDGEALFYVLSGRGETEYKSPGGLPPNKYSWTKNSLFAIPPDHTLQHRNLDKTQPLRIVAFTGYAINLYPYVAEELRSGKENPAENAEERSRTLTRTTYPGHFVNDLREHPVAMREARGNKTAFFNMMATAGHRTHPNVHISELTGEQAFAHKHGNQPMFIILKGGGYDIWSAAPDLAAFQADVKAGRAHKRDYTTGTICGVPAGPHWHQHFSRENEPLRYLAVVPRGAYEDKTGKPASQD